MNKNCHIGRSFVYSRQEKDVQRHNIGKYQCNECFIAQKLPLQFMIDSNIIVNYPETKDFGVVHNNSVTKKSEWCTPPRS